METKINQMVAESQGNIEQTENVGNSVHAEKVDNVKTEISVDIKTQQSVNSSKKTLTPYQQYKNSRNQNGKKYFEFYDDVKVYTHNIWDW